MEFFNCYFDNVLVIAKQHPQYFTIRPDSIYIPAVNKIILKGEPDPNSYLDSALTLAFLENLAYKSVPKSIILLADLHGLTPAR